jgi:hypothetical protein
VWARGFRRFLRAAAWELAGSRKVGLGFLLSACGSTFERVCGKGLPLGRSRGRLDCLSAFTGFRTRQDNRRTALQAYRPRRCRPRSRGPVVSWSDGRPRGVPLPSGVLAPGGFAVERPSYRKTAWSPLAFGVHCFPDRAGQPDDGTTELQPASLQPPVSWSSGLVV